MGELDVLCHQDPGITIWLIREVSNPEDYPIGVLVISMDAKFKVCSSLQTDGQTEIAQTS